MAKRNTDPISISTALGEFVKKNKLTKGIDKVETNPELIENTAVQLLWKDYKPVQHKERSTFKKYL